MQWIFIFLCQNFILPTAPPQVQSMDLNTAIVDTIPYEILNSYQDLEKLISSAPDKEKLVINFWATWCGPCVKELPFFEALAKTNEDKNLRIVLVSLDFVDQLEKRFVPFIKKHELASELYVLNDPNENKWIDKVDPSWSGTIPATLYIKGGKRIFTDMEVASKEEILNFINQL